MPAVLHVLLAAGLQALSKLVHEPTEVVAIFERYVFSILFVCFVVTATLGGAYRLLKIFKRWLTEESEG